MKMEYISNAIASNFDLLEIIAVSFLAHSLIKNDTHQSKQIKHQRKRSKQSRDICILDGYIQAVAFPISRRRTIPSNRVYRVYFSFPHLLQLLLIVHAKEKKRYEIYKRFTKTKQQKRLGDH